MTPRISRSISAAALSLSLVTLAACSPTGNDPDADSPSHPSTAPATTSAQASPTRAADQAAIESELTDIEDAHDARVGVHALDTGDGATVQHRENERFGFASSIKSLAVAELLANSTPEQLDEHVTWTKDDVEKAGHTPVTSEHLEEGLPLRDLAEAAVRDSDNAATNIVFDHLGGPKGFDAALEDRGDTTTEVADYEPEINVVKEGDPRNTTTPAAFTGNLAALLEPENLSDENRETLIDWMSGNASGKDLIPAGAPEGWKIADKSGHADALRSDVAFVFPPQRDPIVIAILTENNDPADESDAALIEETARAVLDGFN
ncbi:MAG: class A beta-lactamase [Brevibacterium sp.]